MKYQKWIFGTVFRNMKIEELDRPAGLEGLASRFIYSGLVSCPQTPNTLDHPNILRFSSLYIQD